MAVSVNRTVDSELLRSRDPYVHARIDALQVAFAELFAFLAAAPPERPRPAEVQASQYRANFGYAMKKFQDADVVAIEKMRITDE